MLILRVEKQELRDKVFKQNVREVVLQLKSKYL